MSFKWTHEENEILLNFLIEKSKNAKQRLSARKLSAEFAHRNVTHRTLYSLRNRICKMRDEFHLLDTIDEKTKEKLIFAIGCVKKQSAEKNASPKQRRRGVASEVETMLKILAKIAENQSDPINDNDFLKEYCLSVYKKVMTSYGILVSLQKRYKYAKSQIASSEKYDEKTKVKMMFISGAPVGPCLLDRLRNNVTDDDYVFISIFKCFDGKLTKNRIPVPFSMESSGFFMASSEILKNPKTEDSDTSDSAEKIPKTEIVELMEVKLEEPDH